MTVGVYMIRHRESGKMYIGSSQDVEQRFAYHQRHYGLQVIHRAIKKHGVDAFEWTILEECELLALVEREQHHLNENQPFGSRGYNIRRIAERNTGITLSEETRKKMSLARRGKPKSAETKARMSEAAKGRRNEHLIPYRGQKHTDETKKRLSALAKGRTWADDEERVRKHSEQRRGKKLSEEHIEKVRQRHIGTKRSEESRQRMSSWQQRSYEVTSPDGEIIHIQSGELTEWLPENNLNRTNFCKAANTGKPYKGWVIKKL